MKIIRVPIGIHIIAILMVCAFITGCVEVTPPAGEQETSAYGPVSQGSGDMKDLVKGQNQTVTPPVQSPVHQISREQLSRFLLLHLKHHYHRLKTNRL